MTVKSKNKQKYKKRNGGSSLLLVTCIGSIAAIMAMAVLGSLLDVYRYLGNQYGKNQISSVCESSVNYAVAKINEEASNGNLASIDSSISVPDSIKGGADVNVQIDPVTGVNLGILDSLFYPSNPGEQIYKRITVLATNGLNKSKIVVIVGPNQPLAVPSPGGGGTSPPVPTTPYFQNAMLGKSSITLDSNANIGFSSSSTSSYSTPLLNSQGNLKLTGNNHILGSVSASGNIQASPTVVVDGNVHSTGTISDPSNPLVSPLITDSPLLPPPLDLPNPAANVLGDATIGNTYGSIDSSVASTTSAPSPTPSSTGSASLEGTQDPLGGASSLTASPPSGSDPNGVYDLGSVNLGSGDTLTLNPGNYTATSFTMGENSNVTIAPSSNGQGVRIYVQGNTPNDAAVTIGSQSSFTNNGNANNFQIFYSGNKNINVNTSSGPFNGLIYAPNADVNITSGTSGGQATGAFVGKSLNVGPNTTVLFDTSSTSTTSSGSGAVTGPSFPLPTGSEPNSFKILTWQEFYPNKI